MEWDNDNIEAMVTYINNELQKERTMVDIEQNDFAVNERVINKRLVRKGYQRIGDQYLKVSLLHLDDSPNLTTKDQMQINRKDITKSNTNIFSQDEVVAIKELISNKDKLLNLLELKEIDITKCNIRSKKNETKSFRVDSGLYEAFKKKANKNNDKITDLINSFMEEYIYK